MIQVHRFCSSGEAYDATQTDDAINDGDVLVVPNEQLAGILIEAWPVAVGPERDDVAFHYLAPEADISAITSADGKVSKDYSESYARAEAELKLLQAS